MENSILTQESVEEILSTAKENLTKNGGLTPTLFVKTLAGEELIIPFIGKKGAYEPKAAMRAIGSQLKARKHIVAEAVFISEALVSLFRNGTPIQDQNRIVVIGRDRSGTSEVMAGQTFLRDKSGTQIFQSSIFHHKVDGGLIDILDALFEAQKVGEGKMVT